MPAARRAAIIDNFQLLLLRLADLFCGNLDDVCAAQAQIEPLVVDGAMRTNLDGIGEGSALPAASFALSDSTPLTEAAT